MNIILAGTCTGKTHFISMQPKIPGFCLHDADVTPEIAFVYRTLSQEFGPSWWLDALAYLQKRDLLSEARTQIEKRLKHFDILLCNEPSICRLEVDNIALVIPESKTLLENRTQRLTELPQYRPTEVDVLKQNETHLIRWAAAHKQRVFTDFFAATGHIIANARRTT
jgi:hypothetical protein